MIRPNLGLMTPTPLDQTRNSWAMERKEGAAESVSIPDLLLETQAVADFLDELACYASANLLLGSEEIYCGITLLRQENVDTIGCSGDKARMLDELQHTLGDGPCLLAIRSQRLVHVPDTRVGDVFPEYTSLAAAQGVRSVLAVPFHLPDNLAQAGLNIYAERENAFTPTAVSRAQSFVAQAAKGLRLALLLAEHSRTEENLKLAMASRTTIDVAVA